MAQPNFWQNARSAMQGSPDDQLAQILAAAGQRNAGPEDIAAIDSPPVAPITAGGEDMGGNRSPAGAFYPTPSGAPVPPQAYRGTGPKKSSKPKPTSPAAGAPPSDPKLSVGGFDLSNPYPGMLRGGFLDQAHEDQLKNSEQQSRVFFMDPEVQRQRMAELSKIPQFAEQEKGNKDYKDLIAMEAARPTPVDLSGALGMADILSNGKYNLRAGYQKPNAEGRTKELLSNLDKAQDNQRDLTKSLTALTTSGKAGNDIITAATMLMNKDNQGWKDLAARRYAFDNPVNNAFKLDASSERIMKPYRDAQDNVDKAIGLLNNGASVSDMAATLETIKPMVSRLTNFEWSKLGKGGTALSDRLGQAYETLSSGKLTEGNRAQYREALQTIREANDAAAQFAVQGRQQLGRAAGIPSNLIDGATSTHYQPSGSKSQPQAASDTHPQDAKPGDIVMGMRRKKTGAWNSPDGWEKP